MTELAISRSVLVTDETAASTASGSGQAVDGSWFPGSA